MKWLLFIIMLGAAVYFGRPYAQPYIEPHLEKWGLLNSAYTYSDDIPVRDSDLDQDVAGASSGSQRDTTLEQEPQQEPSLDQKARKRARLNAGHYSPPEFAALEELTGNWHAIPERAFPREVTIHSETTFRLKQGSSNRPAGSQVIAVGSRGDTLILQISEQSSARSELAIEQTDFKERLTDVYEAWKIRVLEKDKSLWQEEQNFLGAGAIE